MNSLLIQADPVTAPGGEAMAQRPSDTKSRGRTATPGTAPSWLARAIRRCQESVWAPVLLRTGGIAALMLGLGSVGAASILTRSPGELVPLGVSAAAAAPEGWLPPATGTPIAASASATPQQVNPKPRTRPSHDEGDPRPAGITPDGKVILNTANAEELRRLPGVGEKRAAAIVRLRDRLGRFRRTTDLLRVRGIGAKTLRRMLPFLVLDPPKPDPPDQDP